MVNSRKLGRLFAVFTPISAGIFIFSLTLFLPSFAEAAASLYLEPNAATFSLGSTFTVSIYVNTGGQAINAVETNLSFPPDKLQVVSPSTGKSLIQIWAAQPAYSNVDGSLKFQGTVPTPGINTSAGLISTVTFRVKSIGAATIKILDSSRVLLNDGLGTDALGQSTSGIYNLTLPPPAGPIVTSRTHPDQGKWYASDQVVLEWNRPDDAQGYSYILSSSVADEPDNISEGLKTRLSYKDLADRTYYFHIKSLRQGTWGGITSYILNIDTAPPADFPIEFSPGARTSNKRPIINFSTTDAVSGVDHYEIKIIPMDPPLAYAEQNKTQFFFETYSPYSQEFADGRYEVVVRAYDQAGNYAQSQERLTVTRPLFEFIITDGLRIGGGYIVAWPWLVVIGVIILLAMLYFGFLAWKWHRMAEERIFHGPLKHGEVAAKLEQLKEKQREYGSPRSSSGGAGSGNGLMVVLLFFVLATSFFGSTTVFAQDATAAREALGISNLSIEPPVVTLFPKTVSNDEIVYIGGRSGAPQAKVLIYLQNLETGGTISHVSVTDKDGQWFYSLPEFLNAGNYVAWTQLQVGEELSPPSSRLDLRVAKTAVQIGDRRLSFEDFYFFLFVIFAVAFFALLAWALYHFHHGRNKHRKFDEAVKEAEESIRRGFAVLRKDIEAELALIHRAKLSKELSAEERIREEKLLRDLEDVSRHVGQEVWELEHAEE